MGAMIKRDERQIKAMIRLIDDMLDVSRMRSGTLSVRPAQVELMGLLERVVSDLSLQAAASRLRPQLVPARAGHRLVGRVPHRAGDRQPADQCAALRRRLQWSRCACTVEGKCAHRRARQGQGHRARLIERIFEPYERGAAMASRRGWGWACTSRASWPPHGGELTVQSTPGQGSTFSLLLPCGRGDGLRGSIRLVP
jgi:K+-sensing histidine kinase KdpD